MGATISTWGRGWGWNQGLGSGIGYFNNDHADMNINHHFDFHNLDSHHYSYDDYGDLEFGCGDYGMDCSGDFGF